MKGIIKDGDLQIRSKGGKSIQKIKMPSNFEDQGLEQLILQQIDEAERLEIQEEEKTEKDEE